MARSLRVSPQYIERTKLALLHCGISSQRALAADLKLALSTVSRFFTGKPVDYATFVDICDRLGLNWQECTTLEPPLPPASLSEAELPIASENGIAPVANIYDWGGAVDVSVFFGRESELATLQQWVMEDHCRLVAVLGMAGIGKTVLATQFAKQGQEHFDGVIWRSLRNPPPILELLGDLIRVLSGQPQREIPATIDQGITCLLSYLRQSRCLLILDSGESLLQSGDRQGRYRTEYEGYGQLLRIIGESTHKSCLVLTTSELPYSFATKQGATLPIRSLKLKGLSVADHQQILSTRGPFRGSIQAWANLVRHYAGNPLVLKIVAAFIDGYFAGNIAQYLEFMGPSPFIFDAIQDLLDRQMQRLSELEQEVMYWLAINDEPITWLKLQADFLTPITTGELLQVLASLQNRGLIEHNHNEFSQTPLVRQYMMNSLIQHVSDELLERSPDLCYRHALMPADVPDHVQERQSRCILKPVLNELKAGLGSPANIVSHLQQLLDQLQARSPQETRYAIDNCINLLKHLDVDVSGGRFFNLSTGQAAPQSMTLANHPKWQLARSDQL